jgi:ABC-type bacteriocin/lantibiotic exporter with double-glycine peptidase domain
MNLPMKPIRALSLALLLLICPARAADEKRSPAQLHCGAYCLYLGLKALDVPIKNYKELEDKLGQPSPLGYSMEQLAEAARGFGAHALGVETSLGNLRLRPNRCVCIALLKEGHFVNLYDITDDRVYLVDSPETRQVGLDGFRAIWTGKALLISDRPIPDESSLRRRIPWVQFAAVTLAAMAVAAVAFYAATKK